MLAENPPTALLAHSPVVILDGALATELEARGCDLCDPLWSAKVLMEAPELIYQVHYDYFAAGAQCAITASYQATPQGFAARGLSEAESLALIARSVELAVRARKVYHAAHFEAGQLLVAGSVGPYGAFLANGAEYRGDYQLAQAEMMVFHRPRIAALVDVDVDVLACETQPSLPEMAALLHVLREFPHITAWFLFTLRDEQHISDGAPLRDVVALLDNHPQVVALGINCIALACATAALAHLSSLTALPLVVYPDSGEHYDAKTKRWSVTGEQTCSLSAFAGLESRRRAPDRRVLSHHTAGYCCYCSCVQA